MYGLERELWVTRWSVFGDWAVGAVKSIAVIAGWALLIWMLTAALQTSGVFPSAIQSDQHETSVDDRSIERAKV